MDISWEVEDGYVGKSRPQSFHIEDAEIKECKTINEALELINEYTQEEFENNIAWAFRSYDEMVKEIKELIK